MDLHFYLKPLLLSFYFNGVTHSGFERTHFFKKNDQGIRGILTKVG
jgi:hypothetical protein